jgi:hypothetical protein
MGDSSDQLTTNQKIVTWAKGNLGKKIGRGVCWDLGEEALKKAGAKTSRDLGSVDKDADYIWGDPIKDLKDVQPGDILQLRDHLVTTTTLTKYTFDDGSSVKETDERVATRGHHTAIVNSLPTADGVLKTYEQHVNGRDVILNMTLYTRDIDPTTTRSSGKYKHPGTKKIEDAKITKTVTVKVTGTIWAYRPKAK